MITYRVIFGKESFIGLRWKLQKQVRIFGHHLWWKTISFSDKKEEIIGRFNSLKEEPKLYLTQDNNKSTWGN